MSKTFPQESSEGFLNLKKSALHRTKKTSPAFFNRVLWTTLRKKAWFHLASQKRNFLALSHLFWISLWVS